MEFLSHLWNVVYFRYFRRSELDHYQCSHANGSAPVLSLVGRNLAAHKALNSYIPGSLSDFVRVIVVSDTHEAHDVLGKLPPCDVLIHAGDVFIASGNRPSWYNYRMFNSFRKWFAQQQAHLKVFVAGNHDTMLEAMSVSELQEQLPGVEILSNSSVSFRGLSIWGSPLSSGKSPNRAFQSPVFLEKTLAAAREAKDTVDILITHGHCTDVRDVVRPRLVHVMGHLHEHHGCHTVTGANPDYQFVVAAGPLIDRNYEPKNNAVVLDLQRCTSTVQ